MTPREDSLGELPTGCVPHCTISDAGQSSCWSAGGGCDLASPSPASTHGLPSMGYAAMASAHEAVAASLRRIYVLDRLETLENAAGNQGGEMRRFIAPFRPMLALLALVIVQSTEAGSQTTTPTQQEPTQVVKTLPPTPSAKDLEGKDAFSSGLRIHVPIRVGGRGSPTRR